MKRNTEKDLIPMRLIRRLQRVGGLGEHIQCGEPYREQMSSTKPANLNRFKKRRRRWFRFVIVISVHYLLYNTRIFLNALLYRM